MNFCVVGSDTYKNLILFGENSSEDDLLNLIKKYKINCLTLNSYYNTRLDYLPIGIKKIICGRKFNQPLDNLPYGLEELQIDSDYNLPLDFLPLTLKVLVIKNYRNRLDDLPFGLEKLYLPYRAENLPDYRSLPRSLKMIMIGSDYRYLEDLKIIHGKEVICFYL